MRTEVVYTVRNTGTKRENLYVLAEVSASNHNHGPEWDADQCDPGDSSPFLLAYDPADFNADLKPYIFFRPGRYELLP